MNRIYKVLKNKLGNNVVCSELGKSHTKGMKILSLLILSFSGYSFAFSSSDYGNYDFPDDDPTAKYIKLYDNTQITDEKDSKNFSQYSNLKFFDITERYPGSNKPEEFSNNQFLYSDVTIDKIKNDTGFINLHLNNNRIKNTKARFISSFNSADVLGNDISHSQIHMFNSDFKNNFLNNAKISSVYDENTINKQLNVVAFENNNFLSSGLKIGFDTTYGSQIKKNNILNSSLDIKSSTIQHNDISNSKIKTGFNVLTGINNNHIDNSSIHNADLYLLEGSLDNSIINNSDVSLGNYDNNSGEAYSTRFKDLKISNSSRISLGFQKKTDGTHGQYVDNGYNSSYYSSLNNSNVDINQSNNIFIGGAIGKNVGYNYVNNFRGHLVDANLFSEHNRNGSPSFSSNFEKSEDIFVEDVDSLVLDRVSGFSDGDYFINELYPEPHSIEKDISFKPMSTSRPTKPKYFSGKGVIARSAYHTLMNGNFNTLSEDGIYLEGNSSVYELDFLNPSRNKFNKIKGDYNYLSSVNNGEISGNKNAVTSSRKINVVGNENISNFAIGANITGNNNFYHGGLHNLIDSPSVISGNNNYIAGYTKNIIGNSNYVLGSNNTVNNNDSVTLGSESINNRNGMNGGQEAFSNQVVNSNKGAVSVGDVGKERQIIHVAGGVEDTDAVNVRQLRSAIQNINNTNQPTDLSGVVHYDNNQKEKVTLANPDGTIIDNLKNGLISENSKQAINGSQVFGLLDGVKDVLGGDANIYDKNNGIKTIRMTNIGNTGKDNIHDAIKFINEKPSKTTKFTVNNDYENAAYSELVNMHNTDNNISLSKLLDDENRMNINFALNNNVKVNESITIGDDKLILSEGKIEKIKTIDDLDSETNNDKAVNVETLRNAINRIPQVDLSNVVKYDTPEKNLITLSNNGTVINNLGNGLISENSKEAINGSQIHKALSSVNKALGGNSNLSNNGVIQISNVGETGKDDVHEAIKYVNSKIDQIGSNSGQTVKFTVNSEYETAQASGLLNLKNKDSNLHLTKELDSENRMNINIDLSDNINVAESIKIGDDKLILSSGVIDKINTIENLKDAGNKYKAVNVETLNKAIDNIEIPDVSNFVKYDNDTKEKVTLANPDGTIIDNVQNGLISENSKQAINGSQAFGMLDSLKNVLGGDANIKHLNNKSTINMSNIGNTGKDNIHEAIDYINNKIVGSGYTFSISTDNKPAHQIVNDSIVNFNSGKNIKITQDGNNINVATSDNLVADSIHVGNKVSINDKGIDLNNSEIINMKTIDDINDVANNNKGVNVETLRNSLKVTKDKNNGDIRIAKDDDGDVVSVVNHSNNNRRLTGVEDAINDNDAINLKQFKSLSNKVGEVDSDAKAGIAGAIASASLPQATITGTGMASVAVGTYKGQSALAVGYSKISENGKHAVKFNFNVNTRKDAGAGLGYGYMF